MRALHPIQGRGALIFFQETQVDGKRMTISPMVNRKIFFEFRDLCYANGVAMQKGVEQLMLAAVRRNNLFDGEIASTQRSQAQEEDT